MGWMYEFGLPNSSLEWVYTIFKTSRDTIHSAYQNDVILAYNWSSKCILAYHWSFVLYDNFL